MADSGAGRAADSPPSEAVVRYVRRVVADVTDWDEGSLPDALDSMGLDSLSRMNIAVRLEQDLGVLPVTLTFEHRSVAELADYLRSTRGRQLAELLRTGDARSSAAQPDALRRVSGRAAADDAGAAVHDIAHADSEGIAVIGVSGRYPGSPDLEALWETLRSGTDRVTEVPADRWDWRRYYDPRRGQAQKSYGKWGAFLDDVTGFDAEFFNILPSAALEMDPQERLFLETAWNLLEETGYLGSTVHEPSTGVFVGTMHDTYARMGATAWSTGRLVGPDAQPWLLANRVSYHFDFHGPSFAVNSACSSSLTAVHLACESLRRGECRMAIAGGANLILHPAHLVGLAAMNMLSADGRCKVFDARADGFVPGEGVGAVLLKPLGSALADNDPILGVIKATSVNTAGRTSGFTVPSPVAQSDLLAEAVRRAGIEPESISYLEAHGTGTELGDPIELAAVNSALAGRPASGDGDTGQRRCAVGSIKANIGHLEGAAGIASLTKVLLQLKHHEIAPCVNLDQVNPKIDTGSGRIYFPTTLIDWETEPGTPRRAGVSAFGAGGANAHVIVEERPAALPAPDSHAAEADAPELFLLSARTVAQLRTLAERTAILLESTPTASLRALAYTSQVRRKEMQARLTVLARDIDALVSGLRAFVSGQSSAAVCHAIAAPDNVGAIAVSGEEGATFVKALLANRRLQQLGQLWAQGTPIDWAALWPGRRLTPVQLPAYPFERKRYWVPAEDQLVGTSAEPEARQPEAMQQPPATPPAVAAQQSSALLSAVEREFRQVATAYLLVGESAVDMDSNLIDLGFDSISLVGLLGQVGETYGIEFDAAVVFDHTSLRALARFVSSEHFAKASAYHSDNP